VTGEPLVSVVIPAYNRAAVVPRAIDSVRRQRYPRWEIVVVDDASRDDTAAVVERSGDSRIRCVRHPVNRGCPAARNTGVEAATGEVVAFLDSDDEWLPGHLASRLEVMARTGAHGAFGSQYVCRAGRCLPRRLPPRPAGVDLATYVVALRGRVQASSLVFHRAGLLEVRADEAFWMHEDADLAIRFDEKFGLALDPRRTVVQHAGAQGRMTTSVDLESTRRFLARHGDAVPARARALLCCRLAGRTAETRGQTDVYYGMLQLAREQGAPDRDIARYLRLLNVPGVGTTVARARARLLRIRSRVAGVPIEDLRAPSARERG
jgi:hypothetical protein